LVSASRTGFWKILPLVAALAGGMAFGRKTSANAPQPD
jgi:hypothetical protein